MEQLKKFTELAAQILELIPVKQGFEYYDIGGFKFKAYFAENDRNSGKEFRLDKSSSEELTVNFLSSPRIAFKWEALNSIDNILRQMQATIEDLSDPSKAKQRKIELLEAELAELKAGRL